MPRADATHPHKPKPRKCDCPGSPLEDDGERGWPWRPRGVGAAERRRRPAASRILKLGGVHGERSPSGSLDERLPLLGSHGVGIRVRLAGRPGATGRVAHPHEACPGCPQQKGRSRSPVHDTHGGAWCIWRRRSLGGLVINPKAQA